MPVGDAASRQHVTSVSRSHHSQPAAPTEPRPNISGSSSLLDAKSDSKDENSVSLKQVQRYYEVSESLGDEAAAEAQQERARPTTSSVSPHDDGSPSPLPSPSGQSRQRGISEHVTSRQRLSSASQQAPPLPPFSPPATNMSDTPQPPPPPDGTQVRADALCRRRQRSRRHIVFGSLRSTPRPRPDEREAFASALCPLEAPQLPPAQPQEPALPPSVHRR